MSSRLIQMFGPPSFFVRRGISSSGVGKCAICILGNRSMCSWSCLRVKFCVIAMNCVRYMSWARYEWRSYTYSVNLSACANSWGSPPECMKQIVSFKSIWSVLSSPIKPDIALPV